MTLCSLVKPPVPIRENTLNHTQIQEQQRERALWQASSGEGVLLIDILCAAWFDLPLGRKAYSSCAS
jgi:hypothetical protein